MIAAAATLLWIRSPDAPSARPPLADADAPEPEPVEPAPRPTYTVSFDEGCVTPACHASFTTAPTTHAPAARDACATCHAPDAGDHSYPLLEVATQNLCSSCHDVGADKPIQHGAMTDEACLSCHTPHASEGPHLLIAASVRATCDECHLIADGTSRHAPYDDADCTVCHDPHASEHRRLLLAGEGADHCGLCHAPVADDIATARHAHRDLERDCLTCHGAHATNHAGLLTDAPGDLCVSCHEDVERTLADAVVTHDPVITGDHCLSCHAPHASDNPAMLLDDQANVCLSCHGTKLTTSDGRTIPDMSDVIRDSPFVHGPVESSQCSACHAVHGAQYDRLLSSINPAVLTGSFDIHNYALCFSCHDQDLVLERRTTVTTRFRNGDRNLHHLHVQARGSRNCADCHAVHGSTGPHLIAETVPYQGSEWRMPMEYIPTKTGGSCAPGCHEKLSYSRTAQPAEETPSGGAP